MKLALTCVLFSFADPPVDFNRDVRPILAGKCWSCHGADEKHRQAGLRLDTFEGATKKTDDGAAVVPKHPAKSHLLERVRSTDADLRMPPKSVGAPLTAAETRTLERWIAAGAEYAPHWAFVPPRRTEPPATIARWPRGSIDRFVLAKLAAANLEPSEEAPRAVLARRLSFDLRGLPPTLAEVREFENDKSPDAYAKLVDRFLADPAYGERWARVWLDLARYADSAGYGSDPLRTIWRYRDWVIDAYNRNLPFDEFTVKQLAGDLAPNATHDDLLATAFHRNSMTNTEGGTDDEEFRIAAVKDRVDVTFQVWMGLTAGCAKCHNHKYDPLSQQEYYQLFAFFNQTADNDQPTEAPTMASPGADHRRESERLDREIARLQAKLAEPRPELAAAAEKWAADLSGAARWDAVRPQTIATSAGSTFGIASDGAVQVKGATEKTENYTLTFVAAAPLSGMRLETLPQASHPARGAGRGPDGNFVLTGLTVESADPQAGDRAPRGRFVRIDLPGKDRILHVAEVQVFSQGKNVALKRPARQSSTDFGGEAARAVDGNTSGVHERGSVTHTRHEDNPWWEVDLGAETPIDRIEVWNRTDGALETRLQGYRTSILDERRKSVWTATPAGVPKPKSALTPSPWTPVGVVAAAADYEQGGFPAGAVLDNKPQTGWGVGPKVDETHALTLAFDRPLPAGRRVRVTLQNGYRPKLYALGAFRLSATGDANVRERAGLPAAVQQALAKPAAKRTAADTQLLADHYRSHVAGKPIHDEIAKLRKRYPTAPTVPIMKELAAGMRRKSFIHDKGNFLVPGAEVHAAAPTAFHRWPSELPTNRLGLAKWLTAPENPLTARVAVNRLWSRLFGRGFVETEEDFGIMGEPPTHPELLDWLATEFVRLKWDQKALLKTIVMSATYRQSCATTPEQIEKDPANRWLARFPRQRLEAEMVRDQALAVSGLLTTKLGGPSVYPPQPEGLWQAAFNGERTWATSIGTDRYRRGLYVFWRRTVPYPSMATFDAPSRETCTLRRRTTNTPLQALVSLNDPVYLEAAQALARRLVREANTPRDRARLGLELCLIRPPQDAEIAALVELAEAQTAEFRRDPTRAQKFAGKPEANLEAAELAAWTLVANVLLNLDGVLTKG